MTNNTINIDIDALTEDFKAHCKIIKLGYEYPGYTGTEKYAIVTDLSYAQIMERYAPVAEHYCPFLLLSKAAGEVIADFKRNEDKFSRPRHPSNRRRSNRFPHLRSYSLKASPKPHHGKCSKAALFYGICRPAPSPTARTSLQYFLLLLCCFSPLLLLFRMNGHTNHDCVYSTPKNCSIFPKPLDKTRKFE